MRDQLLKRPRQSPNIQLIGFVGSLKNTDVHPCPIGLIVSLNRVYEIVTTDAKMMRIAITSRTSNSVKPYDASPALVLLPLFHSPLFDVTVYRMV